MGLHSFRLNFNPSFGSPSKHILRQRPFHEKHYGVDKEIPVQIVSSRDELKNAKANDHLKLFAYFEKYHDRRKYPMALYADKHQFLTHIGKMDSRYLEFDRGLAVSVRSRKVDWTYYPAITFAPCESYGALSLRMRGTPGDERMLRPELPIRFTTMTGEDLVRESWCKMTSDFEVYTFSNSKMAFSNFLIPFHQDIPKAEIKIAEFSAPTTAGEIKLVYSGQPALDWNTWQIYTDSQKNREYIDRADRNSGKYISTFTLVRCSDPRFKQLIPESIEWIESIRKLHLEKL